MLLDTTRHDTNLGLNGIWKADVKLQRETRKLKNSMEKVDLFYQRILLCIGISCFVLSTKWSWAKHTTQRRHIIMGTLFSFIYSYQHVAYQLILCAV